MAEKKQLTAEEIYKKNQKRAKVLKILAPISFWGFLALSVLCLIFAVRNSFGNIAEIMMLLDDKTHTGAELQSNYAFLVEKYGEWIIGNGSTGFTITFINIGRALFSGLMIANCILSVLFFVSAFVFGKWLLPHLSSQILLDNQDMVNLTVLRQNKE
jgi:hypothetical protein